MWNGTPAFAIGDEIQELLPPNLRRFLFERGKGIIHHGTQKVNHQDCGDNKKNTRQHLGMVAFDGAMVALTIGLHQMKLFKEDVAVHLGIHHLGDPRKRTRGILVVVVQRRIKRNPKLKQNRQKD